MSKTLYLHIGMPKCASTTLQASLLENADILRAAGRFYAKEPADKEADEPANASYLALNLHGGKNDQVRRAVDFFVAPGCDVVLSSEFLIGIGRGKAAQLLLDLFAKHGYEPKLLCYMRRQDYWIESDFKQHIKGGTHWTGDIEELIKKRTRERTLDYHWVLANWARFVGRERIRLVPLQAGQDKGYAVRQLYDFLEMPADFTPRPVSGNHNISPATGLIEPARYLKQALLTKGIALRDVNRTVTRFLQTAPDCVTVPPRRFLLSKARREALIADFAGTNRRTAQDYLSREYLFEDTPAEGEDSELATLSEEAAAVLAEALVSGLALWDRESPEPKLLSRIWARLEPRRG